MEVIAMIKRISLIFGVALGLVALNISAYADTVISVTQGPCNVICDGDFVSFDSNNLPLSYNNSTYFTKSYLEKMLGVEISYDAAKNIITVDKSKNTVYDNENKNTSHIVIDSEKTHSSLKSIAEIKENLSYVINDDTKNLPQLLLKTSNKIKSDATLINGALINFEKLIKEKQEFSKAEADELYQYKYQIRYYMYDLLDNATFCCDLMGDDHIFND